MTLSAGQPCSQLLRCTQKVVNTTRAMVASGLEAGAAGVLAVHADAHLERGPQSPCPDSAHTGSVGRRRRNRRGARGTQLQLVAAVVGASQFFSHQCHALLAATFARCSRCWHRRIAHRQRAARRRRARPSVALFTTTGTLSRAAKVLQTSSNS